ncbi:MAG: hypothetical protein ABIF71_02640 [Planctomycetota bacterium]
MPVMTTIDTRRNLIIHAVDGALTPAGIGRAFKEVMGHPDYQPGLNALWDVRSGHVQVGPEEARQLNRSSAGIRRKHGPGKLAVVVSRAVDDGSARLIGTYALTGPVEYKVFGEMLIDLAHNWRLPA